MLHDLNSPEPDDIIFFLFFFLIPDIFEINNQIVKKHSSNNTDDENNIYESNIIIHRIPTNKHGFMGITVRKSLGNIFMALATGGHQVIRID